LKHGIAVVALDLFACVAQGAAPARDTRYLAAVVADDAIVVGIGVDAAVADVAAVGAKDALLLLLLFLLLLLPF